MSIEITLLDDTSRTPWLSALTHYFTHVMPVQHPQQRANQAICIAHQDQTVLGVATAYTQFNPNIRENFYYYRSSVSPKLRQQQLSRKLIQRVLEHFNQTYVAGEPIGLFFEVENTTIMQQLISPIWKSGAVLVGYDDLGRQQRVIYFDAAVLGRSHNHKA